MIFRGNRLPLRSELRARIAQRGNALDSPTSNFAPWRYLPRAIHVAPDDHGPRTTDQFPGTDFANGRPPGVFAVKSITASSYFVDLLLAEDATRQKIRISRTHIPVAPHDIRASNGCQGISTQYVIIDRARPQWLCGPESAETTLWLHLYVAPSRARSMEHMLHINPPTRSILQPGPPESALQELQRLEALAQTTERQVAGDRKFPDWPPRTPISK